MARMALSWLLAGIPFGSSLGVAGVVFTKLPPRYSCQEKSTACANSQAPTELYLEAQIEHNQVTGAALTDFTVNSNDGGAVFSTDELRGIEFHADRFGRYWLKRLSLSARLLDWAFTHSGGSSSFCRPAHPLSTHAPAFIVSALDAQGLGGCAGHSDSQPGIFAVQGKDTVPLAATLQWPAQPFEPDLPEDSAAPFDSQPWPRTVSGQGFSVTESSAQVQARTNLKWHIDNEHRRCDQEQGQFSFREESMRCSKVGLYRCDVVAICYCRDGKSDDSDREAGDGQDTTFIRANMWVSPVLSDRLDCQAIALKNPGLCRGQDCRGILYHALNYCRSSDCRAIVRGLSNLCHTRDCRALVYNNFSFCESSNCRAALFGNPGLCR